MYRAVLHCVKLTIIVCIGNYKRCSCQKSGRECGAGCECRGCVKVQLLHSPPQDLDEEEEEIEAEESEVGSEESDDELQTEIITHKFYDSDDDDI